MILDKALLLKGLGGLTACAAVACTGTYIARPDLFESNEKELVDLISKVGLTGCTNANKECTIKTEGISVKQGENKEKSKTKVSSSGTPGKIKVYKEASSDNYNKGFRFVIEDGDITLTGTGTQITKLEQFETYEIKKEDSGDDWYLTRKKDALEEKRRILGLPDTCTLPNTTSTSTTTPTCTIESNKINDIKFEGKSNTPVTPTDTTLPLTITKLESSESNFPYGYKFSFNPTKDVTISTTPSIKIMKNTNTEFKIKKTGNKLTLEKAWTVAELAKQVGLTNCDATDKTCELPTSETLKLYISDSDKIENGKVTESKKIKYEENAAEHNQGFKFFTEQEINLSTNSKKIEASTAATYEIKQQNADSTTKWYLTKKANANG